MKKGKEEPGKKLQVNNIWTPTPSYQRCLFETGFERILQKSLYFRIIISFYFITLLRVEGVVCLAWTFIFVNLSYENSH